MAASAQQAPVSWPSRRSVRQRLTRRRPETPTPSPPSRLAWVLSMPAAKIWAMVHEQSEQVEVDLDEAVDDVHVNPDDLDLVRHGQDRASGPERARHARRGILDGDAAGRVDAEGRGRGEVRRRIG